MPSAGGSLTTADLLTTIEVTSSGESYSISTDDLMALDTLSVSSGVFDSCIAPSPTSATPADEQPQLRLHQPTAGKRPLSSFTAEGPRGPSPITQPHDSARTISSLKWPAVCRVLDEQCGDRFERVARIVTAEADAGRSLIGVMGLRSGQGCTTTMLCLAARLAARGRRLVVVDANFGAPRLATTLGVQATTGWTDVVARDRPVAEAVVHAAADRVDVLPLSAGSVHALNVADEAACAASAGALRHSHDFVLVDLGAILEPESLSGMLDFVGAMGIDAALVVAGPGAAEADALAMIGGQLARRGCELLGTIENRAA